MPQYIESKENLCEHFVADKNKLIMFTKYMSLYHNALISKCTPSESVSRSHILFWGHYYLGKHFVFVFCLNIVTYFLVIKG